MLTERSEWEDSIRLAAHWLLDCSMWKADEIPADQNPYGFVYRSFNGAMREYDAGPRQWMLFGPTWHTGQAVKAFVMAYRLLGEQWLLDGARAAAEFLMRERITDPADPDAGFIFAPEGGWPGGPTRITVTVGILEGIDGLMHLGDETGEEPYWQAALAALDWVARRAFIPDEGLFYDIFDPETRQIRSIDAMTQREQPLPGRPLLDDGVFLKGYRKSRNEEFRTVFYATAERLLRDEDPPGNFILYSPSNFLTGQNHPRHAYWWGRPMIMAWQDSGDRRYLDCAQRCARFYEQSQRLDGGLFRETRSDFKTASFGHCTSGALCAAILWHDLITAGQGNGFREAHRLSLEFGRKMQFTQPADPDLKGAILEKVVMPDGTDRCPYMVRDVASIFYVQAVSQALLEETL